METILTPEDLPSWERLDDERFTFNLERACNVAGDQRKFLYHPDFKAKLTSTLVSRWDSSSSSMHSTALRLIRILCRDEDGVSSLLSKPFLQLAVESSGLPALCEADIPREEREEAIKCLINALFRLQVARRVFLEKKGDVGLTTALAKEGEEEEMRYLLLHLAFIVSATERDAQNSWRDDITMLSSLLREAREWKKSDRNANESLKVLFNIFCHARGLSGNYNITRVVAEQVVTTCVEILLTAPNEGELIQNTVNLFATVPLYGEIVFPFVEKRCKNVNIYGNRDMTCARIVLDDLSAKLQVAKESELALIGTYLTVLINMSTNCKEARRFLRLEILPPLHAKDVERPPELGDTMRNKLVRVMQSTSQSRELAAEFLYVLCKRSVNRLIKYTGLGHSAGLLANSGLLGRINEGKRASDSEDSETEDYKTVEDQVNPVTGYMRGEKTNVFEGMTEEQKEYEAMKLVEQMDKMLSTGIIKPGTIGPDGRLKEVSHVLELTKNVKTPEGSDSDS